jgi:hypothetical protein
LGYTAELQVEIVSIIPFLLDLLGDPTTGGGENAISMLIELAEQGAFQLDIATANLTGDTYTAEYRPVISSAIPLILKFLESKNSDVRGTSSAATIAKLADHSALYLITSKQC